LIKNISFVSKSKYGWDVAPKPYPASQSVPDWWKNLSPYAPTVSSVDGKKFELKNGVSNASAKKCVPMLDALVSGYVIPLWSDVHVTQAEHGPNVTWRVSEPVFHLHGPSSRDVPPPPGYSNVVMKFNNFWIPKTPKGYSVLITSPFGYQDVPFKAIPAIVDSDKSTSEIVAPMWVSSTFEGILEKGTPLLQITPFKREEWKADFSFIEHSEYLKIEDKNFQSTIVNHYIKKVWDKKTYK
jgi:hypothetical protein